MKEMKKERAMSNELATILMSRKPETVVHNTRKILSDRSMSASRKMQIAHEYLSLIMDTDAAELPEVESPKLENEKVRKYQRIPFNIKMKMIEYYINNDCTKKSVSKKFGVAEQTGNRILLDYEREHPELFTHKHK